LTDKQAVKIEGERPETEYLEKGVEKTGGKKSIIIYMVCDFKSKIRRLVRNDQG
jgi:hypothetical protein